MIRRSAPAAKRRARRQLIPSLRARARFRRLTARLAVGPHSAFDEYALRRLILRDYLAVERTRLANERTALSYFRTALAMTAGAITILHLSNAPDAHTTAWTLLAVGGLLLVFGAYRFVAVARRVRGYARLHQHKGPPSARRAGDGG